MVSISLLLTVLFATPFGSLTPLPAPPEPGQTGLSGDSSQPASGTWRAWLDSPGGELPFGLELRQDAGTWNAVLVNGPERITIPSVEIAVGQVLLRMDHYDSHLAAKVARDGKSLTGTWEKRRSATETTRMAFYASHGAQPRFPKLAPATESPQAPADAFAGRWQVAFASDTDPAVGVFRVGKTTGNLFGTFLTATGDYRYLAGQQRGDELALSCFDGAHAFLFRATRQADGTLAGDFWSRDTWHDTWTAVRDDAASVPDPYAQTTWDQELGLAGMVFTDLEGRPRSLADPAFAGRARILQVFGSWCPNCHDETAFLAEFERRYRDRGLAVVGIAFELTGGFERDRRQLQRFEERYDVQYPLLIGGVADKSLATQAFGALDRVRSYPTTIFLHADGRVRSIHSGFTGPGTGAAYDAVREEFTSLVEELLNEPEPDDSDAWEHLSGTIWSRRGVRSATTLTFVIEDGERVALRTSFGADPSQKRVESLPVTLGPGAVTLTERDGTTETWRVDRTAQILYDSTRLGRRFSAAVDDETPLLARGAQAGAALAAHLASEDPLVRREALFALARERMSRRRRGCDEAVSALDDPHPEVRAMAAWACGATQESSAQAKLFELLEGAYPQPRREAARSLLALAKGDPAILPRLRSYSDDLDPIVRALAAR